MASLTYVNKWLTFAAAAPVQLSSGLTYLFPIWSQALKSEFGFSQTQVETVGAAANFGGYSGVVAGLIYDALADRHLLGPRVVVTIGAAINCCGYFALWLALRGFYSVQYWQVVLLAVLACSGGTWTDVASVASNVRNFPNERGTVVGLMKAYVGLSASIYSSVYYAFFAPDSVSFLGFLAVVPALVELAAMPLFNIVPFSQQQEVHGHGKMPSKRRFLVAYQAVLALAVYQAGCAAWRAGHPEASSSSSTISTWLAAGTLALLLPILLVPMGSGGLFARPAACSHGKLHPPDRPPPPLHAAHGAKPVASLSLPRQRQQHVGGGDEAAADIVGGERVTLGGEEREDVEQPLLPATAAGPGGGFPGVGSGGGAAMRGRLRRVQSGVVREMPSLPPLSCLASSQFWLLFVGCTVTSGAGLLLLNNVAQVLGSLGGNMDSAGIYASLFSVANCCGRLAVGYLSERALHSRGTPRPFFMVAVCLLAAAASAAAALASPAALLPISLLLGLAFGGCWALMPALASELFGLRHMATNYCLLQLAPALGGFSMASQLAGRSYSAAGQRHGDPPNTCFGRDCFGPAFGVAVMLCLLGAGAAAVLSWQARSVYYLEWQEVSEWDHTEEEEEEELGEELGEEEALIGPGDRR